MKQQNCFDDSGNLRLLRENEIDEAMDVWNACFVNTPEYTRWYFKTHVLPERVLGLFEDGRLVSNTLMIPYRVRIRGKEQTTPYIVGAATLSEHRRKGHMERVLCAALMHMRALGAGVTFLHPFRYSFYQKLGWERATSVLNYEMQAQRLRDLCEPGEFRRIRSGDGAAMLPVYEAMAIGADPVLLRTESECEYRLQEALIEGGFGLIGDGAYALGYKKDDTLKVFELACAGGEGIYPMLGALAREEGISRVAFAQPSRNAQPARFMDEPPPALSPFMMMRVVDVEKALCGLNASVSGGGMTFGVTDAACKWNEGVYHLSAGGGSTACARSKGASPDFVLDVSTLAMLITGYMGFVEAVNWRLVDVKRQNELAGQLFTRRDGLILEQY